MKLLHVVTTAQVGDLLEGVVEEICKEHVFIRTPGGVTGLLHRSQVTQKRLSSCDEVFKVGDKVKVCQCMCETRVRKVKVH